MNPSSGANVPQVGQLTSAFLRLSLGRRVTLVAAAVGLLSTFLHWYGVSVDDPPFSYSAAINGWHGWGYIAILGYSWRARWACCPAPAPWYAADPLVAAVGDRCAASDELGRGRRAGHGPLHAHRGQRRQRSRASARGRRSAPTSACCVLSPAWPVASCWTRSGPGSVAGTISPITGPPPTVNRSGVRSIAGAGRIPAGTLPISPCLHRVLAPSRWCCTRWGRARRTRPTRIVGHGGDLLGPSQPGSPPAVPLRAEAGPRPTMIAPDGMDRASATRASHTCTSTPPSQGMTAPKAEPAARSKPATLPVTSG